MSTSLKLRSAVTTLEREARRDLSLLWRRMDSAAMAGEALNDLLPAIVDTYGLAASAAAAQYYDDARDRAGARRRFTAEPVVIRETGSRALVGYALNTARTDAAFKVLIEGGLQRRIANFARLTVTSSSIADPGATGWVRVGVGECEWCQQYLDGEVRTVEGYDFDAHDWCKCEAEPVFD